MRHTALLLALAGLVLLSPSALAQRAAVGIDSLTHSTGPLRISVTGTATLTVGDSVRIAVDVDPARDLVLATYASAKTAEAAATSVLSWSVTSEGTLTFYGTSGKSVTYAILR